MKKLALWLALATGSGACAHKQLTNKQVAGMAIVGGAVLLLYGGLFLYCHQSCNPQ
jgi:hypothetical protein